MEPTIDLTKEKCPMNLVKFKFYFYEFSSKKQSFNVLLQEEGFENIINFLNFKNVKFEEIKTSQNTKNLKELKIYIKHTKS